MRDNAEGLGPSSIDRLRGDEPDVWDLVSPKRGSLARLRKVSLRSGAWFAVLVWEQRRFLDAVIKTVDKIRSGFLLRTLAPLVRRLLDGIGGNSWRGALVLMDRGAYKMMVAVAEKIVQVGQEWGNRSAGEWLDRAFIKYLLVMNLPQNRNLS